MSLANNRGQIVFRCDGGGCSASLDTGAARFERAFAIFRERCWYAGKTGGSYRHYCLACQALLIRAANNRRLAQHA